MEKIRERTGIYHEHQEGSLCAQHALNSLLQNPMFLADSLADIARELDLEETVVLEQQSFESENMDDTGFFNIQVLQRALKIFEIELVPYESQDEIAKQARDDPECIQAYICHLGLHWFTLRRFGRQYFNLNSMYFVPEMLPQGLLPRYLTMIQEAGKATGCSVFIVHGSLPQCVADQQLSANPLSEFEFISLTKDLPKFCVDEKLLTNVKKFSKDGNPVINLPKHLYDKYQKNPNDPQIRKMVLEYASQSLPDEEYVEQADYDDLGAGSDRPLLVTVIPKLRKNLQTATHCDCPFHRDLARLQGQSAAQPPMNESSFESFSASQSNGMMITEQVTRLVVSGSSLKDPYAPSQQRVVTAYLLSTNRSGSRNGILVDDPQPPLVNQTRMRITNDDSSIRRSMTESSKLRTDALLANPDKQQLQSHRNRGLTNREQNLMQIALTQTLIREVQEELNDDTSDRLIEEHLDKYNQGQLDLAIAASLAMTKSTEIQSKEPPIITENVSSTPKINSKPLDIEHSPLTTTASLSTTRTDSLPSTDNHSAVVTDIFPAPLVNTYSPPTTHSPTTVEKSVSSLPETAPDYMRSLSIDELRQRRLQIYGNRDRSIISQQSNYND